MMFYRCFSKANGRYSTITNDEDLKCWDQKPQGKSSCSNPGMRIPTGSTDPSADE
jgi:hypothetical protein